MVVSFPDPTLKREKGLGTLERFLGLADHHVATRAPIQIYANNHMIADLAEPRIGANVTRPFPRMRGGSRNETSITDMFEQSENAAIALARWAIEPLAKREVR